MSQGAEVKAIQLAVAIAENEKRPELYLHTEACLVASPLLEWLQQCKQNSSLH